MCFLFIPGDWGFILGKEPGLKKHKGWGTSKIAIFLLSLLAHWFKWSSQEEKGPRGKGSLRASWQTLLLQVISELVVAHLCGQPVGPLLALCGRFPSEKANAIKMHKCLHIMQSWWLLLGNSPKPNLSRFSVLPSLLKCHHHSGYCADVVNYSKAGRRSVYSFVPCWDQIWTL